MQPQERKHKNDAFPPEAIQRRQACMATGALGKASYRQDAANYQKYVARHAGPDVQVDAESSKTARTNDKAANEIYTQADAGVSGCRLATTAHCMPMHANNRQILLQLAMRATTQLPQPLLINRVFPTAPCL